MYIYVLYLRITFHVIGRSISCGRAVFLICLVCRSLYREARLRSARRFLTRLSLFLKLQCILMMTTEPLEKKGHAIDLRDCQYKRIFEWGHDSTCSADKVVGPTRPNNNWATIGVYYHARHAGKGWRHISACSMTDGGLLMSELEAPILAYVSNAQTSVTCLPMSLN